MSTSPTKTAVDQGSNDTEAEKSRKETEIVITHLQEVSCETKSGKSTDAYKLLQTCRKIFVNNSENFVSFTDSKRECDEQLRTQEEKEVQTPDVQKNILELKAQSKAFAEELRLFATLDVQKPEESLETICDQLSQYIIAIRQLLTDHQQSSSTDTALANALLTDDTLIHLTVFLEHFSFEAGRDMILIVKFLFTYHKHDTTAYMEQHITYLPGLFKGYECTDNEHIAHVCGSIIRQCARQEVLCQYMLNHADVYNFFVYVRGNRFEVASDAFSTFALILTKHKGMATQFLLDNFETFVKRKWMEELVSCRTYVTIRQSLNVLRDILTDRANFKVMMKYINDIDCLQVLMFLMLAKKKRDRIKNDCWDIFKIFILNPRKTDAIRKELFTKKAKILKSLDEVKHSPEVEKVKVILTNLEDAVV